MRVLTRRRGTSNEDKRRKAAFVFAARCTTVPRVEAPWMGRDWRRAATRTDAVWPEEPCTRETGSRQSVALHTKTFDAASPGWRGQL
jgi:hypothetical protein